eukprot:1493045-Amphidinium_carterae.1
MTTTIAQAESVEMSIAGNSHKRDAGHLETLHSITSGLTRYVLCSRLSADYLTDRLTDCYSFIICGSLAVRIYEAQSWFPCTSFKVLENLVIRLLTKKRLGTVQSAVHLALCRELALFRTNLHPFRCGHLACGPLRNNQVRTYACGESWSSGSAHQRGPNMHEHIAIDPAHKRFGV